MTISASDLCLVIQVLKSKDNFLFPPCQIGYLGFVSTLDGLYRYIDKKSTRDRNKGLNDETQSSAAHIIQI